MRICAYLVITEGKAMQDLIKATKALSDETRLRILNVLLERECCVCEVMQALDISQSRASRNLGILEDAGFLTARRDGAWIVYSVDWQAANHYATSLAKLLKDSPISNEVLAQDKERLKHAVRVGPAGLGK
jgi:ArsR family transcriptional regulator